MSAAWAPGRNGMGYVIGYLTLAAIGFLAVTVWITPGSADATATSPPPFDIRRTTIAQRAAGTSGWSVDARLEAIANEQLRTVELAYCGPAPMLVTVDGSTVDVTVSGQRLRAELHTPVPAGQRFELGIMTAAAGREDGTMSDLFC